MKAKLPDLNWTCHTPNLLAEVLSNKGTEALRIPLNIFSRLLCRVAERASQLNDPELNLLMMDLTLYDIADPDTHSSEERSAARETQRAAIARATTPAGQIEHRPDCQLLTVETYGLCTCDFDSRMKSTPAGH